MEDWTQSEEVQQALRFVRWYREKHGVTPTPGSKPEGSCFANGEFVNLLYGQLVTTPEFTWGWGELRNPEVLAGVVQEIKRNRLYQQEQEAA